MMVLVGLFYRGRAVSALSSAFVRAHLAARISVMAILVMELVLWRRVYKRAGGVSGASVQPPSVFLLRTLQLQLVQATTTPAYLPHPYKP